MKLFTLVLALILTSSLWGQKRSSPNEHEEKGAVTIGFLQGGGSLVGIDFEFLISDDIGLQFGGGFIGYGAGVNIHFKKSVRSSFISLLFSNQGYGESFAQNSFGPAFVYRGKIGLTFQIGLAALLNTGPQWPVDSPRNGLIFNYAIGIYNPW